MDWIKRNLIEAVIRRILMTWLGKLFKGELGWKTIGASLAIPIIIILGGLEVLNPEQVKIAISIAAGLFGVGVRDAIAKITPKP